MSLKMTSVSLVSCNFLRKKTASSNATYCLSLEKYENKEEKGENSGFTYSAVLSYDLMKNVKKPAMKLTVTFELKYEGAAEDRQLLKEHIVIAHSITFLREFVSNITMRTLLGALIIEPVNASHLWLDYTNRTKVDSVD